MIIRSVSLWGGSEAASGDIIWNETERYACSEQKVNTDVLSVNCSAWNYFQ